MDTHAPPPVSYTHLTLILMKSNITFSLFKNRLIEYLFIFVVPIVFDTIFPLKQLSFFTTNSLFEIVDYTRIFLASRIL